MALKAVPGSWSKATKALEYAISNGAKVSSNSYGALSSFGGFKNILDNNPQHIFVVASGNNGLELKGSTKFAPCSTTWSSNVLCVGNSNKQDERRWSSNYGTDYVHVMAPGTDIDSCGHKSINSYVRKTGTRYVFKPYYKVNC